MDILTVPKTVASFEYAAARLPLTLVETQLVARFLPEDSEVRLGFEKALGSLDVQVARLIGSSKLASSGAALSRKAEMLTKAVQLEEKASARKQQALEQLQQTTAAAGQQRQDAERTKRNEAEATRAKQQADKRAAAQQAAAQAKADTAAVERERRAKLEAEHDRLTSKVHAIDTASKGRTAAPKAQLREATDTSRAAAKQKQTAARLGQLADAEKTSRRTTN